jgi:hypothetical protein
MQLRSSRRAKLIWLRIASPKKYKFLTILSQRERDVGCGCIIRIAFVFVSWSDHRYAPVV